MWEVVKHNSDSEMIFPSSVSHWAGATAGDYWGLEQQQQPQQHHSSQGRAGADWERWRWRQHRLLMHFANTRDFERRGAWHSQRAGDGALPIARLLPESWHRVSKLILCHKKSDNRYNHDSDGPSLIRRSRNLHIRQCFITIFSVLSFSGLKGQLIDYECRCHIYNSKAVLVLRGGQKKQAFWAKLGKMRIFCGKNY